MRRVLLVYSRVGGGHLSAARAVAAELEATGRCSARLVDAYLDCGRFPVTLFPAAYGCLARSHPRLWSLLYNVARQPLNPDVFLGPFLRGGFQRLLTRERPDVVVSVLPVVNGLLAAAARSRVEVVLTDWYAVHPLWVARGVDHYTAPTESAKQDCIRFGAVAQSVDVVGIPVRREFARRGESRERCLTDLDLDPGRFTVLAMVGAEGSPRALKNLSALMKSDIDAQLVVVCGRNDEMRRQVQLSPSRMPVRALGFVEGVADLMRAADVLVTKAGGLTLAEAFCIGAPVVIYDALPGQEAGNLEYALREGAVAYASGPVQLAQLISELAADPSRRAMLASAGARLARPDAARQIAHDLLMRMG